jgi:hypothetical protein
MRVSLNALASLAAALTLLLAGVNASGADTPNAPKKKLDDTSVFGFDWQYATSFAVYDFCGDTTGGKLYRKILIAKMEACPFTDAAKKAFYINATHAADSSLSDLIAYFSTHSSMPTMVPGGSDSCSHAHSHPAEIEFRKKLEKYDQGKIPLSSFTAGEVASCNINFKELPKNLPPIPTLSNPLHEEK